MVLNVYAVNPSHALEIKKIINAGLLAVDDVAIKDDGFYSLCRFYFETMDYKNWGVNPFTLVRYYADKLEALCRLIRDNEDALAFFVCGAEELNITGYTEDDKKLICTLFNAPYGKDLTPDIIQTR